MAVLFHTSCQDQERSMPLCVAGCSGQQPLCIQRHSRSPDLHSPLSLLVRSPRLSSVHVFRSGCQVENWATPTEGERRRGGSAGALEWRVGDSIWFWLLKLKMDGAVWLYEQKMSVSHNTSCQRALALVGSHAGAMTSFWRAAICRIAAHEYRIIFGTEVPLFSLISSAILQQTTLQSWAHNIVLGSASSNINHVTIFNICPFIVTQHVFSLFLQQLYIYSLIIMYN